MPIDYKSRNSREAITSRLRLRTHDYREPGPYFITICAEHRQSLFGSIHNAEISFTESGVMIDQVWQRLHERFPSAELNAYVIMPNHMHGIVTLDPGGDGYIHDDSPSLSDIVHWFKRKTIQAYAEGVQSQGWPRYEGRLWQRGFMEHVIRNEREMDQLHRYIENNVALWEDDIFHPRRRH